MTGKVEVKPEGQHPDCTCDLEQNFGVVDDEGSCGTLARWFVQDAECVEVARCSEERFAKLIKHALNSMDNGRYGACAVHPFDPSAQALSDEAWLAEADRINLERAR